MLFWKNIKLRLKAQNKISYNKGGRFARPYYMMDTFIKIFNCNLGRHSKKFQERSWNNIEIRMIDMKINKEHVRNTFAEHHIQKTLNFSFHFLA